MKRMKKVLAMLLAFTMVMGMSLTTFAADSNPNTGNITVNGLNANEETTVKLYKVISHEASTSSWAVESWAAGKVTTSTNPVDIKWADLKDIVTADGSTVAVTETKTAAVGNTSVEFEDLAIGAYLIVATGSSSEYNAMGTAIYTYDATTGLLTAPAQNVIVWAKYSDYDVTKELTSEDGNFVKRGETVTFDITTTFPSYLSNETNRTFVITDTPTGLDITGVVVTVGGSTVAQGTAYSYSKDVTTGATTVSFLSDYIGTANAHAGKKVVVSVTAVVTSDTGYTNTANTNKSDSGSTVTGYTGKVNITKTNEEGKTLTGAEFTLGKELTAAVVDSETGEVLTPATYENVSVVKVSDGVYKVALVEEAGATTTLVATNGTLVVSGLDEGVYKLTETKAPAGYSINDNIPTFEIEENNAKNVEINRTVVDTKLSALPETGGIGTAVFTIGGCAIMVAAAYFFLASRKKES